jgi:tagatose 6-phosphate kinase
MNEVEKMILTVTLNAAIDKLYIVDSLLPHEVMRVRETVSTAGGKGLNVSRAAAGLGQSVVATGFVGGYMGEYFMSLVNEKNIIGGFTRVKGETRCCINIRDKESTKSTEFLEAGSPVSIEEIESFLESFTKYLMLADVVTISGSMPKGVPEYFYNTLIKQAKSSGKKVILDASGDNLKNALKARPTMIKPNTDEIKQLVDIDVNSQEQILEAARMLHHEGIPIVAVSMGEEGVLVVSDEGDFLAAPPKIDAVNTVGCGDSMVGGFAAGLAKHLSMEDTIRCAVAVSAANAMTEKTGSFNTEDYKALLPKVSIRKL